MARSGEAPDAIRSMTIALLWNTLASGDVIGKNSDGIGAAPG
jgi:hypothetical protein